MSEQKEVNIQVVVRIRPLNTAEQQRSNQLVKLHEQTSMIELASKQVSATHQQPSRIYQFDNIFSPQTCQQSVYERAVSPLIQEFIKGYNCSIFAYGQTGSGKSYTMTGPDQVLDSVDIRHAEISDYPQLGVIPRAVAEIFEILNKQQESDFQLRISNVEVYNEEIYDLLAENVSAQEPLKLFEERPSNAGQMLNRGKVVIQGVNEVLVKTPAELFKHLQKSNNNRRVAETKMNEHSSRSHSIFTIQLINKYIDVKNDEQIEYVKISKLNLIDLAGSESINKSGVDAYSAQAREASKINKSLLTLGRVITLLTENASHIPYRESKLTRLLQDSLGGKTRTCIIATISPADVHLEETGNTLEYMTRAKKIKNMPEITQNINSRGILKEYSAELKRLRELLEAQRTEQGGVFISNDDYAEFQEYQVGRDEQLKALEAIINNQIEEMGRISNLMSQNRSKYVTVKQELSNAVKQYQTAENDLNLFEQKVIYGKEIDARNIKQLNQLKQNVSHKVAQTFEDGNISNIYSSTVGSVLDRLQQELTNYKKELNNNQLVMKQNFDVLGSTLVQKFSDNYKTLITQRLVSGIEASVKKIQLTAQALDYEEMCKQVSDSVRSVYVTDIEPQIHLIGEQIVKEHNQKVLIQLQKTEETAVAFEQKAISFSEELQAKLDELKTVEQRWFNNVLQQQMSGLKNKLQQEQKLFAEQLKNVVYDNITKNNERLQSIVQVQLDQMNVDCQKQYAEKVETMQMCIQQKDAFVKDCSARKTTIMDTSRNVKQLQTQHGADVEVQQKQIDIKTRQLLNQHIAQQQVEKIVNPTKINNAQIMSETRLLSQNAQNTLNQFKSDQEIVNSELQKAMSTAATQFVSFSDDLFNRNFKKTISNIRFDCVENVKLQTQQLIAELQGQVQEIGQVVSSFNYDSAVALQGASGYVQTPFVPKTPQLVSVKFPENAPGTDEIYGVKRVGRQQVEQSPYMKQDYVE